jgi:LacI family transcriptional regulator
MPMKEKIKVAFAHQNISHNTQGIMAGITDFIRNKGDWQLIVWPDSSLESLNFLKQRGCKGAFVSVQTSTKAQQLLELGIPVIAVTAIQDMLDLPFITADPEQVAKMAFDYLIKKHFKQFGFFGLTEALWSQERLVHFSRCVARTGVQVHVYEGQQLSITNEIPFAKLWTDMVLNKDQQELVDWLRRLPKPVAILASCDILACHLANVAREAGLAIPDEAAILGINDDQAICNLCDPPLSSIAFNLKKAGYDAAQLMDGLISGNDSLRGQRIQIQPAYVKSRGSTDIFAIDDPDVIAALTYIRKNSQKPLQVDDVAETVCVSKRSLQMKFQKNLGRSVHDEIVHAHFELAKVLLVDTNLPIDEIAVRSGFHYTTNMRRVFKETTGLLPHKYRQANRLS